VAGLYVNPPDRAAVLPADGKRRIRAPGRTQKPLPTEAGHPETRTHGCKRHGTACLTAAPDTVTGKVTGRTAARHRSEESVAFPDRVAEGIGPDADVRAVPDSVSPHR